ncbi:MAG: ATP-binding protein, partial [Pseudomonadota bacterium]|nr:ATP-binding protein [Pseudomonadota bacterium]
LEAHASRLEYRAERGLRKDKVATLLSGQYLHHAHNIIVTGATGCGKTVSANLSPHTNKNEALS